MNTLQPKGNTPGSRRAFSLALHRNCAQKTPLLPVSSRLATPCLADKEDPDALPPPTVAARPLPFPNDFNTKASFVTSSPPLSLRLPPPHQEGRGRESRFSCNPVFSRARVFFSLSGARAILLSFYLQYPRRKGKTCWDTFSFVMALSSPKRGGDGGGGCGSSTLR